MHVTEDKYEFDINDYGKYYRPLNGETVGPFYIVDEKNKFEIRGYLEKWKNYNFWDYYFVEDGKIIDKNIEPQFNLSYKKDRYKIILDKIQKIGNNKLAITISIINKFLDYDLSGGKIVTEKAFDQLKIRTDNNVYFETETLFNFKPMIIYKFDFEIDLQNENNTINLYVELGKGHNNFISKKFTINLEKQTNYLVNFSEKSDHDIINVIGMENNAPKREYFKFQRIAEKKYHYPEPIYDLFSFKYIDESNSLILKIPDNFEANYQFNGKSVSINVKKRQEKDHYIFYVSDWSFFNLETRKVSYGIHEKYKNTHQGLTLDWDKPSRGIIKFNLKIETADKLVFEIIEDFANINPLIGEKGKWKVKVKNQ